MSPAADSAGVPFEGRSFHENPGADDDGSAPPRLLEALRRFRAHEVSVAEVVAALHGERLLIPLVAVRGDEGIGAHGQLVDKTQELSIVTVAGPDGRPVLPAFTSVAALSVWDAMARPIPIEAARVALAAASEGTPLIVLDPASSTEFVVREPAFEAIATGASWTPCFADESVLDAFLAAGVGEEPLRAIQLAPGDPDARLAGPELIVQLSVRSGLERDELDAMLARLQAAWAVDPVITTRVDSIAVRLDRVPDDA
ncbi:SseB family protein [Lysinimonas soli]|uniref:SseB family protein n=1 Tax=Lysinimonas soli TaxID=1074233 RepID=A0ABW0NLE0_9MICO